MKKTIIAIPRGRIIEECKNILNKTTFAPDPLLFDENSRSLRARNEGLGCICSVVPWTTVESV